MGILALPYVIGFFALFILIKVIGRDDENSAPWQIFIAILVLTTLELAANYVAGKFFSSFETYVLMAGIFFGIGFLTALICKFAFWVPITRAFSIAFFFVLVKIVLAFAFGYMNYGKGNTEIQLLNLWEPDPRLPGIEKTHKDPGWTSYDLENVSIRLPGTPPGDMERSDSAPSKRYREKFWILAEFPKMKLRYDYWHYKAPDVPDQKASIQSAVSRLLEAHKDAHVVDRNEDFAMTDPTLQATKLRMLLDDETIDLEPATVYILSVVRGSEEWLFEIWGQPSEIEKFAQHSFPAITPLTTASGDAPADGDYPKSRTLTNAQNGRKIEATITGRTADQVIFESKGKEFRYDLEKLSAEDQVFIETLPVSE